MDNLCLTTAPSALSPEQQNLFQEFPSQLLEDLWSHDGSESAGQLSCQILIDLQRRVQSRQVPSASQLGMCSLNELN